nr:B434 [uncultured bacterium]ART36403.1 C670 [uncultured bacterium]
MPSGFASKVGINPWTTVSTGSGSDLVKDASQELLGNIAG